ncbi:hypothetical protein CASFOL_004818 [Castilleja foliolosa]|uniref:Uncharacterized protein n=1 Tax=Castilleja foliolosa TaxID=1961234 RepID=A0ABD3EBQ0_9LAMI
MGQFSASNRWELVAEPPIRHRSSSEESNRWESTASPPIRL